MLYESALVGAFNYLWGYNDATKNKLISPAILSNSQNPLDTLIGDVVGVVEGRYFLIEFKATRDGFYDEVHSAKAKSSRANLYAYLRKDQQCRDLAHYGHFAAYANGSTLSFEPYAHAVGPGKFKTDQWHELDFKSFEINFDKLYEALNDTDLHHFTENNLCYGVGLGITAQGMHNYLECVLMHQKNVHNPSAEVNALFGFVNPVNAQIVAVPTSFSGILYAFQSIKQVLSDSSKPTSGMPP